MRYKNSVKLSGSVQPNRLKLHLKTHHKINHAIRVIWLVVIFVALYLYLFERGFIEGQITRIIDVPLFVRYWIYLILGTLRGFTLVPVTYLIILGLLFIPTKPLFLLTMAGVMVSSVVIYYFSEFIHLGEYFEQKYPKQIIKLKSVIDRNEFPIVFFWSMLPFAPTDVICYVCGSLEIDIKKFLAGVLVGEGITCALYIFFGKDVILFLQHLI